MIMMGVSAINVEAMPALVYCTAISENPTPTNGPKMVVAVATVIPLRPDKGLHHSLILL